MGGVFSRSKKAKEVKASDPLEIDTKLDLQEGVGEGAKEGVGEGAQEGAKAPPVSQSPPPLPDRDVEVDYVTYSSCDAHAEIVTRKPTPYGKPSLESIRRVVSVTGSSGSGIASASGATLTVPNSSGGTSSEPNSSMVTSVSHGGLEVCTSKDVVTLSSDASSSDSSSESSSE